MHPDYRHHSIQLNGNSITIDSILSDTYTPQSAFEKSTVLFIKSWLTATQFFSISTSGSTGIPKQISIGRSQMVASAQMTLKALGIQEDETALVCLNTEFIAGKMMLARALEHNLKIIALEPTGDPLVGLLSAQIDFVAIVPLQLHNIIQSADSLAKLNNIRSILVGGGSISRTLEAAIEKHVTTNVYQTYGMTETISHIALQLMSTSERSSSFKALPGIEINQDDRGCLVAEVPYLESAVVTNDIIDLEGDNSFRWQGRYDNVINSGGIKIIPEVLEGEIAVDLKRFGIENTFFVFGEPDEILGNKLILAFEGLLTLDRNEILSSLKQTVSKYRILKEIRTTPKFCYTETGKIMRKETQKLL